MVPNILLLNEPGKRVLLLGNEAFARGALEAGVRMAAGYPGTPSSEIIQSLGSIAQGAGIYAEWSVNEKVAFEVAYAGAISGVRSLVAFKSVGLNVALDSLMVANATGIEGGFVVITADDPSGHSSQNEQDCRYLAKAAEVPVIEPSDPQEAKDCVRIACELSEESKLPVIIRSVTRLSHVRGDVVLGPLFSAKKPAGINESIVYSGFPCLPHHKTLHERLNSLSRIVDDFPLNIMNAQGEEIGIVTSGVGYTYVREMVQRLGIDNEVAILKIGIANPLPRKTVESFLTRYSAVLVVEDGFPYLEEEVRKLTYELNSRPEIFGKLTGDLPREGELTPELVGNALGKIVGKQYYALPAEFKEVIANAPKAPDRALRLCAGCAHMAMFYAIRQAIKGGKKDIRKGAVMCGDIGCYGLGLFSPYSMFNTHICMGASTGIASGMTKLGLEKPVIGYLGDSTFFHSGIPGLQNAVFNNSKLIVIVQDNVTTAMTGHQENPSVGRTLMGEKVPQIKVENIALSMGVPYVEVVDPYDTNGVIKAITEALEIEGPAVIVGRRKCAELAKREARHKGLKLIPPSVDQQACTGCKTCISQLHCPALIWDQDTKKVSIDNILCVSCSICQQVCKEGAISGGEGLGNVS